MGTTAVRLGEINLVTVPVSDQDKSIEFYVEKLGFEKRTDVQFGDGKYRWVEVYPPSGTTGIALAPPPDGKTEARETGISLTTEDAGAAHAALRSSAVDVDAEVSRMGDPVPPMFWFRDPDGHSLLIVEAS
jgi:catechol 2,3-dioxygenase-like lactoylglutathione lyase family enzyme